MAFPTTSVLTAFAGGNENPLSEGGNWSGPIGVGNGQWTLVSNAAVPGTGGSAFRQSYWTPATFTETEVYCTVTTKGASANYIDLWGRIQAVGTAGLDAYALEITSAAGTDTWQLYRVVNGSPSLIDTFTATEFSAGDVLGMAIEGVGATVTISGYKNGTLVDSFGDTNAARIVSAGNIGFEAQQTTAWVIDDFGGGEVVVGGGGITSKLREDGSGGNENPWATDLDGVAVAVGVAGTSGATDIQILNSRIEMKTASGLKQQAIGAATDFANGVVRGKISLSHAGASDNNSAGLVLRATSAATSTGIQAILISGGASNWQLRLMKNTTFVALVTSTITAGVLYEVVLNAYAADSVRCVKFDDGAFPPGTDYKTIAWDLDRAGVGDGFPSAAGKAGVYSSRNVIGVTTHVVDQLNAFGSGVSVDVVTVAVTGGDAKVTVDTTQSANLQKRATAWYFIRYKAGSAPTDENDGTLWVDDGTGDGDVRADGRFLHDLFDFDITGLTNGTTYHVRPFAVMWDGTIVAGTSQSAAPAAPGSGAPTPPLDFVAAYAIPHVSQRVDFTWTNPSLAGDYKITYRTDGVNPTSSTNGTVLQDWTAYTANSAGSKSGTGLTNGTRYRSAIWHRDAGLTVNTGAFVQKVPVKQITLSSPADATTGLQPNPYLVWATSSGEAESAKPIHYKLEVSTSEASESDFTTNGIFTASSLDDGPGGFEYESSAGVWVELPATGLASADVGKNVRFRFPINVIGQLFWRVSAQQSES